jgi:anti-sigma regulatory factor (Ser/Thr protein kinase)/anti-anti-sigma regulatory factor
VVAIECDVGADGGNLVVTLSGRLGLREVAPLRNRLLKCLAEQPESVLVDLAGFSVAEPLALAVFTAVVRQAARWPGIPVLFCAPSPATRTLMNRGAFNRLPVFHSVSAARDHVGTDWQTLPSISDELLPLSGAARQARNVATDACLRWDLPHLIAPASLIVSELVSNVVDHAQTMATLRLSLHRGYVTIAVRDGSPAEPVKVAGISPDAYSGRGLILVEASAHSWGWLPTDDGKVVWASLAR